MSNWTYSPKAKADLKAIWTYSAESWGLDQADRYIRQIDETCKDLAMGRLKGLDITYIRPGYFKQRIGSHLIFFTRPSPSEIVIIRLLHQSMDIDRQI